MHHQPNSIFYRRYILCQIHITGERRAVTSCLRVSTIREKNNKEQGTTWAGVAKFTFTNPQRPLSLGR